VTCYLIELIHFGHLLSVKNIFLYIFCLILIVVYFSIYHFTFIWHSVL
jgi:hypothetical protein